MSFTDENKNFAPSKSEGNQFKATKIWNDILQAFYIGIELKHHKFKMKSYYDCFTASEAISWLKNHLKDSEHQTGTKVTRFQALNLLRKYHETNIIERVILEKNYKELQDDNSLYHFTVEAKENLPFMLDGPKDLETAEITLNKKMVVYKNVTWSKLIINISNISDFIKLDEIDSSSLYNNINKININGVVQLTDKSQDLPQWILSAMKCLANWPKASGSGNCLPKYPGFEYDVFNLIRDYFVNFEEPLIPFSFYPLIMFVFRKYDQTAESNISTSVIETSDRKVDNLLNLPSNCVYETAFSGREPVTKIVPIDEFSGVFPDFLEYFNSTRPNPSFIMSKTNTSLQSPPFNTPSHSTTFRAISSLNRTSLKSNTISSSQINSLNQTELKFNLNTPPEKSFSSRRFHSLGRNYKNSKNCAQPGNKNEIYESLRLILLILPSPNRRQLQLLIRMFHKLIRNDKLERGMITSKEQLVDIFTRGIIRPQKEINYNEMEAKKLVSFLIDECMNIFKPDDSFISEINLAITKLQEDESRKVYCSQINTEEFEVQRDVLSEKALTELLESIMKSDSMSERDKLKWIKQFKVYHPDVYDVYFTNCSIKINENAARNEQEKLRARSLNNFSEKNIVKRFLSLKF